MGGWGQKPRNKPTKKNPIDKAQMGREILPSKGHRVINVEFKLDKVNTEKKISVGKVNVKVRIFLIIFINYFNC